MNRQFRAYNALASDLLEYPADSPQALAAAMRSSLPAGGDADYGAINSALLLLADTIHNLSLEELRREHVAMFDLRPEYCLYMAWHIYGDSPQQGRALAALTEIYKDAGYPLNGKQLPDYLPLMLEFISVAPAWACSVLTQGFMGQIKILAGKISAAQSVYAPLGNALAALAEINAQAVNHDAPAECRQAPNTPGALFPEVGTRPAHGSFTRLTEYL